MKRGMNRGLTLGINGLAVTMTKTTTNRIHIIDNHLTPEMNSGSLILGTTAMIDVPTSETTLTAGVTERFQMGH